MPKLLNIEFEKAVRFLVKHILPSNEDSRKPILFHDIRVGVYLYENGYGRDIVLAGVLHDAIEWSSANEQMLKEEFNDKVAKLVLANTKNNSILDKEKRINELIQRCARSGQDALIVKAADIVGSFKWYASQDNKDELQYCARSASAILKLKSDDFNGEIFNELRNWQNKFARHVL